MASHKYKLTYFDARGRAELIRLLFAYGGVEYEDHRITKEEWPQLKATMPFGQIPVLAVDNEVIAQSLAIARFVAKELNLVGKDNLEAAVADMVMDSLHEVFTGVGKYIREQDPAKKEEMKLKFMTEILPPYLDNLEKLIKKTSGKYLVGDKITWADIGLFLAFSELQNKEPTVIDKHPSLKELVSTVQEEPAIKDWIAKRPQTMF